MRRPFALRVQDDDPARAHAIARALEGPLRARDAPARVTTSARGAPGPSIAIGIAGETGELRWLAPIDVSPEPAAAVGQLIAFLERWGFAAAPVPSAPRA